MDIEDAIGPSNDSPGKEEIERMYKCAYYIDRTFFKPADVVDFGIDIVRLKEFGQVVMKKPIAKLRPQKSYLWARMNKAQRTMFLYSYFIQGLKYMNAVLDQMEAMLGTSMSERHALSSISTMLERKFPEELQDKLRDGFGKEWSV